jgi:hypothetical protein
MFGLEIIRINTAFLALAGGAVGVVAAILTYWMIWAPRTDPQAEVYPPTTWDTLKQIPWIIWLTIAAVIAYSILHLIQCARFAPNW